MHHFSTQLSKLPQQIFSHHTLFNIFLQGLSFKLSAGCSEREKREKKVLFFSANHFLCQWQATEGKKFVKGQGCLCFSLQLSVSCINPFLLELIFFNLPLATFARSNQFQSVRKGWSSIYQAFITFLHL